MKSLAIFLTLITVVVLIGIIYEGGNATLASVLCFAFADAMISAIILRKQKNDLRAQPTP